MFKLASVLCEYNYLEKDPITAKYSIGSIFVEIGSTMLRKSDIRTIAKPFMKELARVTGDTINLMVPSGTKGVYIEVLESEKSARLASKVGGTDPLNISAVGKILLAYMPQDQKDYILEVEGLPRTGVNTITNKDELDVELTKIRQNGYAIDDEESTIGARCVAAPIFDKDKKILAAISVSGLTIDMTMDKLHTIAKLVMDAAGNISDILYNQF